MSARKKTAKKPIEKLFKTSRRRVLELSSLVILLSLSVVGLLDFFKPVSLKPKRLPGLFPVTGAYQAYYEIETAIDTANVSAGDEIPIDVYLTTSGEGFDIAVAKLEWNENDFSYKNLSAQGQLNGRFVDARVGGASNLDNNRILTHYVVPAEGDPAMQLTSGVRTKFASLILVAKVNNAVSSVALSSLTDDLVVSFVDSGVDNSVDQSLADQTKIHIVFGAQPSSSPSPSPTPTPTLSPSPDSCVTTIDAYVYYSEGGAPSPGTPADGINTHLGDQQGELASGFTENNGHAVWYERPLGEYRVWIDSPTGYQDVRGEQVVNLTNCIVPAALEFPLVPIATPIPSFSPSPHKDLVVHFPACGVENSVFQNLADQAKTEIIFGGGPSPTCGNNICETGEDINNCAEDCEVLREYTLEPSPFQNIEINVGEDYGVSVLLKDSEGNVIIDQGDFFYGWKVLDSSIASVGSYVSDSVCPHGINLPCPNLRGGILGLSAGTTTILVKAYKNPVDQGESSQEVAITTFNLIVKSSTVSGTLGFRVKFRGIDSRPADDSDQGVLVTVFESGNSANYVEFATSLSVDDSGHYHGLLNLPIALQGVKIDARIKGPKHLARRFNEISPDQLVDEINLTYRELLPGDLPEAGVGQDGDANLHDLDLCISVMADNNTQVADVNLDEVVNAFDLNLVKNTLLTRPDE